MVNLIPMVTHGRICNVVKNYLNPGDQPSLSSGLSDVLQLNRARPASFYSFLVRLKGSRYCTMLSGPIGRKNSSRNRST